LGGERARPQDEHEAGSDTCYATHGTLPQGHLSMATER